MDLTIHTLVSYFRYQSSMGIWVIVKCKTFLQGFCFSPRNILKFLFYFQLHLISPFLYCCCQEPLDPFRLAGPDTMQTNNSGIETDIASLSAICTPSPLFVFHHHHRQDQHRPFHCHFIIERNFRKDNSSTNTWVCISYQSAPNKSCIYATSEWKATESHLLIHSSWLTTKTCISVLL